MDIKDRLLEFIEYTGNGQTKFERIVGLSNGLINNMKSGLRSTTIHKIKAAYPELNTTWLIDGEGEMLLTNQTSNKDVKSGTTLYEKASILALKYFLAKLMAGSDNFDAVQKCLNEIEDYTNSEMQRLLKQLKNTVA